MPPKKDSSGYREGAKESYNFEKNETWEFINKNIYKALSFWFFPAFVRHMQSNQFL